MHRGKGRVEPSLSRRSIARPRTRQGDEMNKTVAAACIAAMALQGCATASKDIAPSYTSPMQYHTYNCDQLNAEAQRIQARVTQLGGRLDEAAGHDKAIAAVGVIFFWPALFALGGTKEQEAEYARLKGEYDAVQQAAIAQKCSSVVTPSQNAAMPPETPTLTKTSSAASPSPAIAEPAAAPVPSPKEQ